MAAEVHRYKVGDIEVTVLSDGFRMVPVNGNYLSNASADDLAKALAAAGQPTDKMKNTYSPIVLTTGGKRVLFDTGNGSAAAAESNNERGTLNAHLAAAGIDRNAIDVVVIVRDANRKPARGRRAGHGDVASEAHEDAGSRRRVRRRRRTIGSERLRGRAEIDASRARYLRQAPLAIERWLGSYREGAARRNKLRAVPPLKRASGSEEAI